MSGEKIIKGLEEAIEYARGNPNLVRACKPPTEHQLDAGAAILRARQTKGKITRPWDELPNSTKKKWRDHAWAVLLAALTASDGGNA